MPKKKETPGPERNLKPCSICGRLTSFGICYECVQRISTHEHSKEFVELKEQYDFMRWRLDDIAALEQAEAATYEQIRDALGDDINLVFEVSGTYEYLLKLSFECEFPSIGDSLINSDPKFLRWFVLSIFIRACKQQANLAFISLFRGHSGSSRHFLRQLIEHCLFGTYLIENEFGARAWLAAIENREDYFSQFKIQKLIDKTKKAYEQPENSKFSAFSARDIGILRCLVHHYEDCCLQVHASIFANMGALTLKDHGLFDWIDFALVDKMGKDYLVRYVLRDIDVHVACFTFFGLLYTKAVEGFKKTDWDTHVEILNSHVEAVRKRLNESEQQDKHP